MILAFQSMNYNAIFTIFRLKNSRSRPTGAGHDLSAREEQQGQGHFNAPRNQIIQRIAVMALRLQWESTGADDGRDKPIRPFNNLSRLGSQAVHNSGLSGRPAVLISMIELRR
jgi:hypothetical protein